MPSMTGDELVARLRERHPGIKALIVTGHGNILDQEAPDWWTREAHLTKPFDVTTLKKTVADLIDRTEPRAVGAHSADRSPNNAHKWAAVAASSSRLRHGSETAGPDSLTTWTSYKWSGVSALTSTHRRLPDVQKIAR